MKIIYYLGTCETCKRIMKELPIDDSWKKREIKSDPLTAEELEGMKELAGSYEELFSKRSRQYRARDLHLKDLSEKDMRQLIMEEYTFLKRPVVIAGDHIFVGNSKKVVEKAKEFLSEN